MSNMKYLGLAMGQVLIGGQAGPEAHVAPDGGALAIIEVRDFVESDHDRLRGIGVNAPAPSPVPLGSGSAGQVVGQIIDEVEAALRNDGQIDAGERAQLIAHSLQHLGAPASLATLAVGGKLDVGQAVQDVIGLFRGKSK